MQSGTVFLLQVVRAPLRHRPLYLDLFPHRPDPHGPRLLPLGLLPHLPQLRGRPAAPEHEPPEVLALQPGDHEQQCGRAVPGLPERRPQLSDRAPPVPEDAPLPLRHGVTRRQGVLSGEGNPLHALPDGDGEPEELRATHVRRGHQPGAQVRRQVGGREAKATICCAGLTNLQINRFPQKKSDVSR